MANVNVNQFKQWCKANAGAAETVFMAQAYAELTRERVNAYVRPILESFGFTKDLSDKSPITKTGDLYLSSASEQRLAEFYQACHEAHIAHGYAKDVRDEPGRCPALIAENMLVKAEQALIGLAAPMFGVEPHMLYGDNRRKYLDLLLSACAKELKPRKRIA